MLFFRMVGTRLWPSTLAAEAGANNKKRVLWKSHKNRNVCQVPENLCRVLKNGELGILISAVPRSPITPFIIIIAHKVNARAIVIC